MPPFYEIAVDAPLAATLTYDQPEGWTKSVPTGCCVRVPLGKRQVTGFVLGTAKPVETTDFTIRPISELLSPSPFFPAALVDFYRWIAQYYHHPLGEVIRTALPVAPGSKSGRRILLTEEGRTWLADSTAREASDAPWLEMLRKNGTVEPGTVQRLWRAPADRALVRQLERQGLVEIRAALLSSKTKSKTREVVRPGAQFQSCLRDGDAIEALTEHLDHPLTRTERRLLGFYRELIETCGQETIPRTDLAQRYAGYKKPLDALCLKGILLQESEQVYRDPFGDQPTFHPPPERLTEEQQQVLGHLLPAIAREAYAPFLLHGITGCGKTEVYLQAAATALNAGKSALILVPEIALASQLEAHFHSRFRNQLAILHSGLTAGERLDQWQRVMAGEARVVLGARSAVFAPLENPGIIIVDEEHEPAYKQEDGLRYHGRDLAVLRARQAGCPVLLGSATPSVVSYAHCQQGKYTLLTMARRVADQPMPEVEIIDLTTVKKSRPDLVFSDRLINALGNTLDRRQQSLLFVNRRGFSSFMLCRDCGHILQCRYCQVSLTLHRSRRQLLCHYCGYTQHPDSLCPACGSTRVTGLGLGSERIEEEVRQLFPHARTARLDSDTSSDRKHYLAVLKAVRQRQVDILIGTQMIAKGLHFPGITLVGVVWADSALGMPDYKAAERTFALLSQVTGRAGRGDDPGKVIIQTYQSQHYAIRLAKKHDYPAFFTEEMAVRQPTGYPPFSRMVNFRFSGTGEEQVRTTARQVAHFLRERSGGNRVDLLGPAPAPLERIKEKTRWQLLLKSRQSGLLHALCAAVLAEKTALCPRQVTLSIDVDPENMM